MICYDQTTNLPTLQLWKSTSSSKAANINGLQACDTSSQNTNLMSGQKSSFDGTINSATPGLMTYNASYEQAPLVNSLSSSLPPLVLSQNELHVNMARPSNVQLKQISNVLILPT